MAKTFDRHLYLRHFKAAWIGTLVTVGLLAIQIMFLNNDFYGFLIWNLFLAWVGWLSGVWFIRAASRRASKYALVGIFTVWLLFLPNTFYLLTDFVHPIMGYESAVGYVDSAFSASRYITDITLDVTLLASATWTGWLLGITSLRYVHGWLKSRLSSAGAAAAVTLIIAASSFAVYLGRVPRWNSWNVINAPHELLADIGSIVFQPHQNTTVYAFTALFFVLISLVYWSVELLQPTRATTDV